MMHNAFLIPNTVHEIDLPPGASMSLLAGNGLDALLYITHRETEDGTELLVVNDQIRGEWGAEERFACPPEGAEGRYTLTFKFNGKALEIWNPVYATQFVRFDAVRCEAVRFIRLKEATNRRDSLIYGLETLDSTLARIDSHILHRRLEALEAQLADGIKG